MNRGKETKYLPKFLNNMLLRIIFYVDEKNTWILTLQLPQEQ